MSEAAVFLFPSRSEGLPNVLLEALSAGAVPISSKLESGVPDILQHNLNGLLVEPGNAKLFAEAIFTVYKNKDLLFQLKSNASKGLQRFEPYQQALQYEQIILSTVAINSSEERIYPKYLKGRLLDMEWMPGSIVILLRKLFKMPKI